MILCRVVAARAAAPAMTANNPRWLTYRLGLKPFRDTFKFRGRSTRTEVASYWLLYMLAVLVVVFSHFAIAALPGDAVGKFRISESITSIAVVVFFLPGCALLARRLQDHDILGWPGALLYFAVTAGVEYLTWRNGGIFPYKREFWWTAFSVALTIAYLVALLRRGTPGPNRYGPDPRLDQAEAAQGSA